MSKAISGHHNKTAVQHMYGIGFYSIVSYLMAIVYSYIAGDSSQSIHFKELFIICASISLSIYSVNTFFITDLFTQWRPFKRAAFILIDVLICTVIGLFLAQLFILVIWTNGIFYLSDFDTYVGSFIIAVIISTVAFIYYVMQERIIEAQAIIHQSESEKIQLAKLKAEMELELLQGKLNPHFLFNSLNSVASLIKIDPVAAEKMIIQLADLFRSLIDSDLKTMHSIDDEFKLIESYLKIEKIRFGERLKYEIKNSTGSDKLIPKLLLQPLVENSIQHVIAKNKANGRIEINAELKNEQLYLSVSDNGNGYDINNTNGFGIQHIKDRLKLIYGDQFTIQSGIDGLFVVKIIIL